MSSLGLLLLAAGHHVDEAAQSDPARLRCSPLGQGPQSPPDPVLSAMLPDPWVGSWGRRQGGRENLSQGRVCEDIGLLPGGNRKSTAAFLVVAWRGACIPPRVHKESLQRHKETQETAQKKWNKSVCGLRAPLLYDFKVAVWHGLSPALTLPGEPSCDGDGHQRRQTIWKGFSVEEAF